MMKFRAIISSCYIATLLHCYIATLLHYYIATLLHYYIATLLHCYIATLPFVWWESDPWRGGRAKFFHRIKVCQFSSGAVGHFYWTTILQMFPKAQLDIFIGSQYSQFFQLRTKTGCQQVYGWPNFHQQFLDAKHLICV